MRKMIPMYEMSEFEARLRDVTNSMQNTALECLFWSGTKATLTGKRVPYYEDHRVIDRPLGKHEARLLVEETKRKIGRAFAIAGWIPSRFVVWQYYTAPGEGMMDGWTFIAFEAEVPEDWIKKIHESCKRKGHPFGKQKLKFPGSWEEAREYFA